MSEELKEHNEPNEPNEPSNTAPSAEDLEAIKAQLQEEKASLAEAQAVLIEKDDRIAQLQAEGEALRAERSNLQQAQAAAITKYLDAVKAANPAIPGDAIAGDTIEDIDTSAAKATSIAEAVKASLAAQAKETKVPAGAPTRTLDLSALSPEEKIRVGLQQKGGAS